MPYQYIPYIWPLIASALITLFLGIYALARWRVTKCATSFILSMLVVTIWSGANALEMSASGFAAKLFWADMQYFAYCYSPVTLLALSMQFTGYDKWIQNKRILWAAILPTVILLLVWTDTLHGLVRYGMHLDYSGYFPVIVKKYGPAFFIHAAYSHLLNITACVLLLRAVFFKSTVYRKQAAALLIGASLIVVPNILYVSGLSPIKRFDVTPVFFGPAGAIMAWSIFHFKFFDLVPIARAMVIDTMDAGMMVLDLQDRLLDINPAFEKIVGSTASQVLTRGVDEICGAIPELKKACLDRSITHAEFSIHAGGTAKDYEVYLSPLTDGKGVLLGRLSTIYEITEKKRAQQEFLKQQWKLAVIEERERMARDMHDNLGQVLGFINLQAQGIRQELVNAGIDSVSGKLDRLVNVVQSAHTEIREYIRDIRSSAEMERNFIDMLKKVILEFEEQTGLRVQFDVDGGFKGEELAPGIRINVLNIVREALNNIRKHAEAQNVSISILILSEQISVVVEDDGKGFEPLQCRNTAKTRFGLNIMRERASEAGGLIVVESAAGKRTRIELRLPLEKGNEKKQNEIDAGR